MGNSYKSSWILRVLILGFERVGACRGNGGITQSWITTIIHNLLDAVLFRVNSCIFTNLGTIQSDYLFHHYFLNFWDHQNFIFLFLQSLYLRVSVSKHRLQLSNLSSMSLLCPPHLIFLELQLIFKSVDWVFNFHLKHSCIFSQSQHIFLSSS